ncbi:ANR family transcriptional regulator [Enterobacter asburiae]|uniref:ANR family transcriptional regulator n=1 Tax=Enterobacter asburiae TaxID=61645 RepID=UPI002FFA03EC
MTLRVTETPPEGSSPDMKNAYRCAETAAGLERKRNFAEAARWWLIAADAASSQYQRHWCECRASLCERHHKAPLAQPVTP